MVEVVDSVEVFSGHDFFYSEVLRLLNALNVVVGIVDLFSCSVCSSFQCSCYQSLWF